MEKTFVKKVLAVVLGISLFVMLISLVSLIMDAVLTDDVMLAASKEMKPVVLLIKWSLVAVVCLTVPAFVCYAFTYFSKNPAIHIMSAVLSYAVAINCIVFLSVIRAYLLENFDAENYAAATEFFSELMQLAIPAVLMGAYFTVSSVKVLHKKEEAHDEEA